MKETLMSRSDLTSSLLSMTYSCFLEGCYYRFAPPIATMLEKRPSLRGLFIRPLVLMVSKFFT
jgi:hypothetical protein